ncbi:hypothetical protein BDQ17DRAFT_1409203 [Cyathus striatus]|nr:hypothetical protein BDQ17DRAFT_1409203 [Cyathus striatus]
MDDVPTRPPLPSQDPLSALPMSQDDGLSHLDPANYAPSDRPLNVTDALSYLDAVKGQFHDQPDVYNHFLDIMKEFKHELIDTPGVIKRVSHLFNGHPALIQGFNTFLPIGYRIECSTDHRDSGIITVTTPTGTTMQSTSTAGRPPTWSVNGYLPDPIHSPDPLPPRPSLHSYPNVDGQAIEPAVQYVQKIKQRCDPDTYRQFLDILSRYHHKPESIDEEEVSRQIAHLFKDDPDLRADFRVFMPERSQSLLDDSAPDRRRGSKLDVVASSSQASSQKRKRKVGERERERERERAEREQRERERVGRERRAEMQPPSKRVKHSATPHDTQPYHKPPLLRHPSSIETHFFDRVKRFLDNRELYNEFLKLVNLFTQDFIDTSRLVKESKHFLGESEIWRQFCDILGWDERREVLSDLRGDTREKEWLKPRVVNLSVKPGRNDLGLKYGSYRQVSAEEANVTCSGRDEMCRSVLNDDWVSHPTWSSEDSGFIAHKKNIYEEALHRSEEERHEYDFHIDAISRTIIMLEPINLKIMQLSPEERGTFKLKANLGGIWKAIHTRVVKKIYGREPGLEVIQAMQESPAQAIPVVFARLKQKEEEWKRAQREWNKVWREVDARNYTKSLDHQVILFRAADKKAISTKSFVSQIEAAREEQVARRAALVDPLFSRTRPRHQLEFVIDDVDVLQDCVKLTLSFLDRTQAQIGGVERRRIESFLRSFVPLFFGLDTVKFNSAFVVVQETGAVEEEVVEEDEVPSTGVKRGKKGLAADGGDLRKKLLKSEQAKSTKRTTRAGASPAVSRLASPALGEEEPVASGSAQGGRGEGRKGKRIIFFTNTIFYTFLRLLEMLYSRLHLFKTLAQSYGNNGTWKPSRGILAGLSAQAKATLSTLGSHAEHYYSLMLESIERLFDSELETSAFEDQMRYMFGVKEAYKIFTIDKLVGAIVKQVQGVIGDPKSQGLLDALKREKGAGAWTTQDLINARRGAEKILGPDENLFRIDWLSDSKTMAMQLIGKDDSGFDDSEVLTSRWEAYIDSYVSRMYGRRLATKSEEAIFAKEPPTLPRETQPDVATQDGLEIKVCLRTYRFFYGSHSEDILWRYRSKEEVDKHSVRLAARNETRRTWVTEQEEVAAASS